MNMMLWSNTIYAYCENDLVYYVDPSGNSCECNDKYKEALNLYGEAILGAYYEEAVELYKNNPDWYPNPDECVIVQEKELNGTL